MAPPTVLTYFRNHHRRTGSSPQSPQSPQWGLSASSRSNDESARSPSISSFSFRPSAIPSPSTDSPLSPHPPSLPPIPRVASTHESDHKPSAMASKSNPPTHSEKPVQPLASTPPVLPPIPRVMTRKQPYQEPLRIKTTDSRPETGFRRREQPPPTQIYHHTDSPHNAESTVEDRNSALAPEAAATAASATSSTYSHASSPQQSWHVRPSTPPSTQSNNELHPPLNHTSRRASSPASSFSSFQKSAPSSNGPTDSSPGSSRSAAQPTATTTAAPSRAQKSRMNLLNPVSLLRRRRTSQNTENMGDTSFIGNNLEVPVMGLPDDYDPRIKGKGVHDFNAPRPRRHHSTNAAGLGIQVTGDNSPVEEYKRRSSILPPSEDPDAGQTHPKIEESKARDNNERPAIFTEQFDDDGQSEQGTSGAQRESLANSSFLARMSRKLDFDSPDINHFKAPNVDNQQRSPSPAGERTSKSTVDAPSVRVSSEQTTARSSISNETRATSPSGSPASRQQRKSLTLDAPFQPEGLARHYPSSASRSSRFSFQLNSEATLAQERELEEKGKEKAAKARRSQDGDDDDDERGFDSDSDDVTNYDDIEDDPYEEPIPMVNAVDDMDDDEQITQVLATDTQAHSNEYPIDAEDTGDSHDPAGADDPSRQMTLLSDKSDSLYFDDGMIGDPSPSTSQPFDESYFDSPVESKENGQLLAQSPEQQPKQRIGNNGPPPLVKADQSSSNTPLSGLDAYHDALATAATKAEADGRFRRKPSVDISLPEPVHDNEPQVHDEPPSAVDDLNLYQPVFEDSDLDGFEDDPMIAAANAEILASEDSEFYGREFGFYGGLAETDGEGFNGGYFRSSADDLNRSASGRNASREPNLTPITERSEFSHRNSFTSLHGWGSNSSAPNSAVPRADGQYPNPGLKDMVARMSLDEDDMTLTQLMKLRKQTFGRGSGSAGDASPSASFRSESPSALQSTLGGPVMEEESQDDNRARSSSLNSELVENFEGPHAPSSPSPYASRLSGGMQGPGPTSPFLNSSENTPKPLSAFKAKNMTLPHEVQNSPPPIYNSASLATGDNLHVEAPKPPFAFPTTTSSAPSSPIKPSPSTAPAPLPNFMKHQSSNSAPLQMPMPSPEMMQKFASRPPASSASYAERDKQRNSMASDGHSGKGNSSSDSVAYVREDSKWYLERRRRLSGGEFVVIGRELIEGGRI